MIATVDFDDAGVSGGSNIFFNQFDISGSASVDPNFTNLNFMLIDNVRITNFANVVSVTTTNKAIFEGSNAPAIFTVTRTQSGTPLTVNYFMSGSASNGVDYTDLNGQPLSGSVTFAADALTTNISAIAVDGPHSRTD